MAIIIPSATNLPILAKNQTLVKKPYLFKGYKFNGTSQYIDVPDNVALRPANFVTMEVRMKLTVALASQPQAIIFFFERTSGSQGYVMYLDRAANALVCQVFLGAGTNAFVTYSPLSTNVTLTEWHHYAGQYDGDKIRLYVDGVNVATSASFGSTTINYTAGTNLDFGGQGASRFLQGYLSDARLWSTARTTQQIYDNQFAVINDPRSPGLTGYWRFDETSGTSAFDFTPNANTGTLINTPTRQLYIFKELAQTINLSAHAPKDVGFSVNPKTTPAIHITAHAPAKTLFVQHPARALITLTARTPKLVLTQHLTSASIHLSAHAPAKTIFTQHPARAIINMTARTPKIVLTQHLTPATVHISAHAPAKTIFVIHPTPATIHISAHAPKSVQISKIYPTHATIHLASNSVKTNMAIKPAHATIHLAVSAPTNRLTQHVSRCVVHLALPPPKVNLKIKPARSTIHLSVNSALFVQNKVKPNPCTIHLTAKPVVVISVVVNYKFTVKIRKTLNFNVKIPDMD